MEDYLLDEDESKGDIEFKDDLLNYRGYFVENGDEEEKKFYEYGAHFPYMYLYQRLEIIAQERKANKKELGKKLEKKEKKMNNIDNKETREDPATNEESKQNENLKDLLGIFKQKGKSRNRGDVDIGLTYMPQMNRKKEEQSNVIENIAADLIKSSAGKNEETKTNDNKIIKNIQKNYLAKKEELIGANLKYNNYINKKEKNNANKVTKKPKSGNQQIKIRKRNENKIWNINNSLNGNITLSLNILNKTKFGEKNNSKNMTHDIPYMEKLTNNLVNKLKSIQYSKEKLRKQILNTGNTGQNLNKKENINKIINKFRNLNNKGSFSNYYGYQNTKNTTSSKKLMNNNKKKIKINKIGISSTGNQINEKLEKNNKINNNSNIRNNILSKNALNSNNNNKFIKQNNFLSNLKTNNKGKNIYNINKNLLKKANVTSKNNISINDNNNNNNNKNQKNKIPNNNYKTVLLQKENLNSPTENRNQYEFMDNIGSKKTKNNISRNNNIPIFNNQIQNSLNKNFHSVNNPNKKNIKAKTNHVNINLTNNLINVNVNQQPKSQVSNKKKEINYKFSKYCYSNINLKKYSPGKASHKKSNELSNNNKKPETQKRKNINNIQEQLKSYLLKANDIKNNINKNKKMGNKSSFKNNVIINMDSDINKKKNIVSRNREENSNINAEKISTKKNNTMMQNKKKHHININININNQQNIILNKLSNGLNNNSINICSVRSSDTKKINNNKMEKNQKNNGNYFI